MSEEEGASEMQSAEAEEEMMDEQEEDDISGDSESSSKPQKMVKQPKNKLYLPSLRNGKNRKDWPLQT